ncbi:Trypsin [Phytophthora infestans]|uniref:Trypsin n=1 Tax=Phytophthora infestans TaxID=4787 RepID=A0A8S9UGW9_PHYIN|nr:Trypsin [Phytophthora infestans]
MKNFSTLSFAALALTTVVEGRSLSYYTSPFSAAAAGRHLSRDVIATSLNGYSDSTDVSSSKVSNDTTVASLNTVSIVPSGTKTYVAGLRDSAEGNNVCYASLISPSHLLVGTYCVSGNIPWASVGSHYVNGTQDGEQIRVIAKLNHPKSSNSNFSHDFAVLVLEKPGSFKPVALASADENPTSRTANWLQKWAGVTREAKETRPMN